MTRMALLVPLLGVAQLGAVSAQAAPKPHLVFLLVVRLPPLSRRPWHPTRGPHPAALLRCWAQDDLGYNSFFHNPDHQTPEVNRLAREEGVIIESTCEPAGSERAAQLRLCAVADRGWSAVADRGWSAVADRGWCAAVADRR